MREGSAKRVDGTDCNGVAEAACPSKAVPGVVGSKEAVSLRTTPSLAREVRPESSLAATTLGRGRSPDRPEEREGTRTDPGHPKDDETHPRSRPGDPGQASNTGGSFALRHVAKWSIDGLPQTRSSDLAT